MSDVSVRKRPSISNAGDLSVPTLPPPLCSVFNADVHQGQSTCATTQSMKEQHCSSLITETLQVFPPDRASMTLRQAAASLCRNHAGCRSFCATFQMLLCVPMKKPMFPFQKKIEKMSPCSQISATTLL